MERRVCADFAVLMKKKSKGLFNPDTSPLAAFFVFPKK
jgi:hypothetical protein